MVKSYVRKIYIVDEEVELINKRRMKRYLVWLQALCFQLRITNQWEHPLIDGSPSPFPNTEERTKQKNEVVSK